MPIAKAAAIDNEIFYSAQKSYVSNIEQLAVSVENPNITLSVANDENYAYVMATHAKLPNNHYIIYQRNSANFPTEVHCEAAKDDTLANWLCQNGLEGTAISGSMSQNFNTYVLKGTGNGDTNAISSILANIGCNASETNQNKSCEVIVNNPNSVTKITCKNKDDSSTCTYTTYRSDSSQDICYGQRAQLVNGECVATMKGSYEKEYDENGNMTEHLCNNYTTGSGCYALGEEVYDAGGPPQTAIAISGMNTDNVLPINKVKVMTT